MPRQNNPTGEFVEILGLEATSNGRSSEKHAVNGEVVVVGSIVSFRRVLVDIEDMKEWAIGVYAITNDEEDLLVGFLGRFLVKRWQRYEGRFAVVKEMYKGCGSTSKRAKSHRSCGAAEVEIVTARDAAALLQQAKSEELSKKKKRKLTK